MDEQTTIPSSTPSQERFSRLRRFNLMMFVLHAVQGVLMLVLSSDFSLPITTSFVQFNATTQRLEPILNTIADMRIGPLVAGFLLLSSLAHFCVSVGSGFRWYVRNLQKGANYARWMEYALSSSLMILVIALLVGIYDIATLLCIFFLNMMMILFGWMMELHNQTTQRTNWTSFIFGCIAGIVPWIAVFIYLIGAGSGANEVPAFVYWIYVSIFIFFNVFAINMILQYKKVGRWRDYVFGERAYIILSLVAKSLLAWQVWAGTLRPV
jgi:hypothetical protein